MWDSQLSWAMNQWVPGLCRQPGPRRTRHEGSGYEKAGGRGFLGVLLHESVEPDWLWVFMWVLKLLSVLLCVFGHVCRTLTVCECAQMYHLGMHAQPRCGRENTDPQQLPFSLTGMRGTMEGFM